MKLAIGVPGYGGRVHFGHVLQASQLMWAWASAKLPPPLVVTVDTCSIDKARNTLVAHARDAKCDWLLMCDADTYYPVPKAIAQMLATGEQRGAAVIGAPVKMRNRPGYNVGRGAYENGNLAEDEFKGAVVEVDRIGTAFTAIRLGWLVKNWPMSPWFKFDHLEAYKPSAMGEDYWFCKGVRERGGLILADGRFEPAHVGATDETVTLAEIGANRVEI